MKNSPLISVVLPTYNVAQYLQQCLESVAAQTYQNIEVIIIIDGATDGSNEIAQEFCKIDSRFFVYWQENAGSGPARNNGLAHCNGELVMFVDPDDWIEPELLEKLYEAQSESNCDLVASTRIKVECDSKGQVRKIKPQHLSDETLIGQDVVRQAYMRMLRTGVVSNPTQKLFKLSVIREHQVEFPPLKRSQDIVFNYRYYSSVQSLRLISYSGYYYRAMPTQTAGKSHADYYKTIIYLYNDLQAMYQSWGMAFPEQEMCNWFFHVRIYSNLQKSVAQRWDMARLLEDTTILHIVQTAKPSVSYLKMTRQLVLSRSYRMLKLFLKLILFIK
ncbi:MAG: glycosyltransferase family 2 protein [Bacteroidaceae bacterium]|nr:glycosyltransferase family 2 protein [Bacteroidaceae bacterium]